MLVYLNTLTCKKHAILTTELPKKNPQARSCKEKHVKLFSKIYVSWTNFCCWNRNFLFHYYSIWTKFLCCNFKSKLHIQVYWNNVPRFQIFSNPFMTNKSGSIFVWKVFNYDFVLFYAVVVIETFLFRLLQNFVDLKQQKTKFLYFVFRCFV